MLGRAILVTLLAIAGCTTVRGPVEPPPGDRPGGADDALPYDPLDPGLVHTESEEITVEGSFILRLYTCLHSRDYRAQRVRFPGVDGQEATAHLLVPPGSGPHPVVLVFPILAGSHVVSEGLAKALVNRGFGVLRFERRALDLDGASDPAIPGTAMRNALLDARRMLDWLAERPEIDPDRIGVAGVSLGGILAATLLGVERRIRFGVLIMAGGGLPEILYESSERPVRAFRDRLMRERDLHTREAFLQILRPHTADVDPLTYASFIDPARVLLVSGRFDRVVRPQATRALWDALHHPTWIRLPVGHYQLLPFFWWSVGRGADHLDRALANGDGDALQPDPAPAEAAP